MRDGTGPGTDAETAGGSAATPIRPDRWRSGPSTKPGPNNDRPHTQKYLLLRDLLGRGMGVSAAHGVVTNRIPVIAGMSQAV